MNKQALLQGMTQPEERLLFAKVLDQAAFSYKRQTPAFTDFLAGLPAAGPVESFWKNSVLFQT